MDRYLVEYPDFLRQRIRNLAENRGYGDLIGASLTNKPLAKTADGQEFLTITTAAESTVVGIEVTGLLFAESDLPVMERRRMKKLES